jgi:hypothetical protein
MLPFQSFNLEQLFYGEEQSFYLFDNGASNYLYGYARGQIMHACSAD